jgi:hypothetical protein
MLARTEENHEKSDIRFSGVDSNQTLPEYKSRALSLDEPDLYSRL